MHAGVSQQLVGSVTLRRSRGAGSSADGERFFNDAMAWISQQKVSAAYSRNTKIHNVMWLNSAVE